MIRAEAEPAPNAGPVASARAFCLRILEAGDLASKLAPPVDAAGRWLDLDPWGPPVALEGPARDPGLRMRGGGDKLPRPGELARLESRRLCLARFAHHELMAVEYFAWALLRWPTMPLPLRRGLLVALADEQRHCRLYLDRLTALGGHFDGDDHSDYFWRQAPAIAASPAGPAAFLAAMGLTLEQANLDFTLTYRDAFAMAGDTESAAICQQVHDDEIKHVALAEHWLVRLHHGDSMPDGREAADASPAGPDRDLAAYLASVPFPLAANRAKGRRFEVPPRRRAGMSAAFIEFVRTARSAQETGRAAMTTATATAATSKDAAIGRPWILPNLGAEEGLDWRAYPNDASARVAAGLLALLFPRSARLVHRRAKNDWAAVAVDTLWPESLGPAPDAPVWPWLDTTPDAFAWLATRSLVDSLAEGLPGQRRVALAGPDPDATLALHDKAFAVETARALGLHPASLDPLVEVLDPADLAQPDVLLPRLERALAAWPDWTRRRFTLKPRLGSSGRGRIGGEGVLDTPALRGGLARLARRGGAVLEPWLERTVDLSTVFHLATPDAAPGLLASFELITSASGVFRGHCGVIGAAGEIRSGDDDDARLRMGALAVAARAAARGFFGVGGIDAFRYRTAAAAGAEVDAPAAEHWRGLVELNARPTMGLVTAGLIRRALPLLAPPLVPREEAPLAFLFTQLAPASRRSAEDVGPVEERIAALLAAAGPEARVFELARRPGADEPRPLLLFAPDRDRLRAAHRAVVGC